MKLITKTFLFFAIFLPSFVLADVIYVDHAAQGLNNGTSWQNAFTDLQDALNSIPAPDTIWVAKGTYYPTDGTDRNISYSLPNGVAIFGGFEGTETQLSQRDWETHETILSGDIGISGDHSDNSFSILYATQTDTTTTLDGLMVKHGNANSNISAESAYGPTKSGGGLYLYGLDFGIIAQIKISNCIFSENYAIITGGAIFCYGFYGTVDFIISNTQFIDNVAESAGGALCKLGGCNIVQNLISCSFENNSAGEYGGAFFSNDLNVEIDLNFINCNFINNESHNGGAISRLSEYENNNNNLYISDCFFEGNESFLGGAISDETYFSSGNIYISNSHFKANTANGSGGAFYDESLVKKDFFISNSIFENNSTEWRGTILTDYPCYSVNNLFYKNNASYGACIYGISNDTKIYNTTFIKNTSGDGSVFKGLNQADVEVINCIFLDNGLNLFSNFNNLEIGASLFDVDSCESIASSGINCHPDVLFNVDPLFRDTANLDFSLLSCSPAINAGNTVIIDSLGILEDIAGNDRVIDGIVDIGAYEQAAFSANLDSVKNESCFGNSNGAVYLSASGNPPIDISWQSGSESGTNTENLSPGVYDFFITDADGCSDTLAFEIEAATGLTTNFESNDASGVDVADGSINFEVISGGTPGYTYEWDNGATTASISDLLPGNYFLTVTDAIFCKYGFAFSVGVTTGVEDLMDGDIFKIQPNPAYDYLKFEIENPLSDLHHFQLFDELGRLVLKTELSVSQNQYQISLDQVPAGFYHFNIVNDQKIVKKGKLVVLKN